MPSILIIRDTKTGGLHKRTSVDGREMVANGKGRYVVHDDSFEQDSKAGRTPRDPAAVYAGKLVE